MRLKKLLYFGCIGEAGHHLWEDERGHLLLRRLTDLVPGLNSGFSQAIDGVFTPATAPVESQSLYQESIVPPLRIVAWWDRSIDKRPGSNSALLGYQYNSADEMLNDAITQFPSVMKRQPRPLPYRTIEQYLVGLDLTPESPIPSVPR